MAAFIKAVFFLASAAALAAAAALVPAHLRSVDPEVLQAAATAEGRSARAMVDARLDAGRVGPARRLIEACLDDIPTTDARRRRAARLLEEHPRHRVTGGPDPQLERYFDRIGFEPSKTEADNLLTVLLPETRLSSLADFLASAEDPVVQKLLEIRTLRGMTRLRAAGALGQRAELALAGHTPAIRKIESVAMATIVLGRRYDYLTLADLASVAARPSAWVAAADLARKHPDARDTVFAAVLFAEAPGSIQTYLGEQPETGWSDLRAALALGPGAVQELVERGRPVFEPRPAVAAVRDWAEPLPRERIVELALRRPIAAFALQVGLLLASGFALAFAFGAAWRGDGETGERLGRLHPAILLRDGLLSVLAAGLLWTFLEPAILKLSSAESPAPPPARFQTAIDDTLESLKSPLDAMPSLNHITLLILALFGLLQLIVYALGVIKIKEIGRQNRTAEMKLKLLENEENLFDLGLYVGLGGTVAALIFVSVGIVEASLMAAYASTLFGILFVALLKIFHLRPFRRRLILEAGTAPPRHPSDGDEPRSR